MKVYVTWKYKHSRKPACIFQSDYIDGAAALIIAEDLEKTGRAHDITFTDEKELKWSKKELKKLLEEVKEEPQDVTVYFDGGFNRENKLAGIGVIVYYKQNDKSYRIRQNQLMEQLDTNNEAEYAAFYESLRLLEEIAVHHQSCTFKGDSQVVLNQLSGDWPCFDDVLNRWADRIEEKMESMGIHPIYEPISRKENKEADALASQALEGTEINSTIELSGKEEL
ncbi:MAG: reverse transcriptase-like protein [Bacillus sp. (in: firmicutes)]